MIPRSRAASRSAGCRAPAADRASCSTGTWTRVARCSGWSVDPYGAKFEDGWIWGMGAHDDKGGVVAAISAVEAIVRSGTRLKGDVLVTPVIAHKHGGAGTRALLKHGVKADLCINMEHSNNTIANVCVGVVMVRFTCSAPELFFRYSPEARAAFMERHRAADGQIVQRLGPSLRPIPPGGYLTFEPDPELPGFPALTYRYLCTASTTTTRTTRPLDAATPR